MLVLGIECTAHTFGIGIVETEKKQILFNEKQVFSDESEGMNPRKLSEFHISNFDNILKKAKSFLLSINKDFNNLDLISFSRGPGQGNSLKIAALVAKTLALKYNIKIIGVNHIKSHLEIGKMVTGFSDPLFLNITGVNSQVIAQDESGEYKVYGETEDIGLGNLLDTCAREMELGFPGGPVVEKLAEKGKNYIEIPYTIKGMNVSFAGLNSFVKQQIKKFEDKKPIKLDENNSIIYKNKNEFIYDLCYSLQETCFAMIMEVAERAMAYTNKKEMVLVGGVASNKRFVKMAKEMCKIQGAKYSSTPMSLCMDNGVMIAWCGYIEKEKASLSIKDLKPLPYVTIESKF